MTGLITMKRTLKNMVSISKVLDTLIEYDWDTRFYGYQIT